MEKENTLQEENVLINTKTNFVTKEKKIDIHINNVLLLIVAGIINALGVNLFLIPGRMLDGGISGTSMLINYILENQAPQVATILPFALIVFLINLPFLFVAVKKTGIEILIYSLVAIGSYSLTSLFLDGCFGLYTPLNQTEIFLSLREDSFMIACSIFGGALSGLGSGLTIKAGGCMDGIDCLSVLLHKKLNLTVGQFCMVYNVIIYVLYACLNNFTDPSTNNLITCLYSIISYFIGLKVIDFVNTGFDRSIMALIISKKSDELSKEIQKNLSRGSTFIKATGSYSKENFNILYCVCNRFEVNKMRILIESIDSEAFVTFTEVSELIGKQLLKNHRQSK